VTGSSDSDSLERIVPEDLAAGEATGDATLRLHLERYEFAARHMPPGRILDLACGVGYGSAMLASRPASALVIGADLSRDALAHARRHYAAPGIQFVRADGAGWLRAGSVDGVTSLETLEHVVDPAGLFAQLVALLRPGGTLVASVPVTPSVDANPHHVTDFTEGQFVALGARHGLAIVARLDQVQRYSPVSVVARTERRTRGVRRGLPAYYLRHPGAFWRRIAALARFGFTNRYLTIAWRREPG